MTVLIIPPLPFHHKSRCARTFPRCERAWLLLSYLPIALQPSVRLVAAMGKVFQPSGLSKQEHVDPTAIDPGFARARQSDIRPERALNAATIGLACGAASC
jgi:hypothetical protein